MFVDASAIVAILTREPEADALANALEGETTLATSPIAVFEAVLGLCRKRHASVGEALADVRSFLELARVEVVAVTMDDAETALDAFARYGKGRGHPARLNLGDCFAYAGAQNRQMPLLFKGKDFTKTDVRSA